MDVDATLTRFFAKLTRYLILIGAVLGCLGVFGIKTASFAAVLAAAGFAVGMAFQGTLDESVVKALSK
jgi:small conductance mechanosensitive channel